MPAIYCPSLPEALQSWIQIRSRKLSTMNWMGLLSAGTFMGRTAIMAIMAIKVIMEVMVVIMFRIPTPPTSARLPR